MRQSSIAEGTLWAWAAGASLQLPRRQLQRLHPSLRLLLGVVKDHRVTFLCQKRCMQVPVCTQIREQIHCLTATGTRTTGTNTGSIENQDRLVDLACTRADWAPSDLAGLWCVTLSPGAQQQLGSGEQQRSTRS